LKIFKFKVKIFDKFRHSNLMVNGGLRLHEAKVTTGNEIVTIGPRG